MQKRNAQDAIQFLTTYGWMIILIAIVLSALYYFGVFNAESFQARAPPGACSVYRPGGLGSIQGINLAGVCDGELPEFISRFTYNGFSTYLGYSNVTVYNVSFMPAITKANKQQITLTGWTYLYGLEPFETILMYGNLRYLSPQSPTPNAILINVNGIIANNPAFCAGGLSAGVYQGQDDICIDSNTLAKKTWFFFAVEMNGSNLNGYMLENGKTFFNTVSISNLPNSFVISPASTLYISAPLNGTVTNIQMYNTSLSKNDVISLYREGLAGAPIKLENLVGWWPLNGNLNDYSGNQNNGYAYNSAGISGAYSNNYTAP